MSKAVNKLRFGYFGKYPGYRDFVQRGLTAHFVERWNDWVSSVMSAGSSELGDQWLDIYLTSPIWRFAIRDRSLGDGIWLGALMPSMDAQHRYFPLCVVASLPEQPLVQLLHKTEPYLVALEDAMIATLQEPYADTNEFARHFDSLWESSATDCLHTAIEGYLNSRDNQVLSELDRFIANTHVPVGLWHAAIVANGNECLKVLPSLPSPVEFVQLQEATVLAERPPDYVANEIENTKESGSRATRTDTGLNQNMQLRWVSGACSHVGNLRERNEDSILERPDVGIWAVADGMGGHDRGDYASSFTISELPVTLSPFSLNERITEIDAAAQAANSHLIKLAGDGRLCGTTLTVITVVDRNIACLWIGDSRAYLLREGSLEQMTHDHTELQALIDAGEVDDLFGVDEDCRHVLTRAIGGDFNSEIDQTTAILADGDVVILCSDGLSEELDNKDIAEIVASNESPRLAAKLLVERALEGECSDNVSVLVVRFEEQE